MHPTDKQKYIDDLQKYVESRGILTIVFSMVILIIFIVIYNTTTDRGLTQKLYNASVPLIVFILLLFYLVFVYQKRRNRKLRTLIGQMSEEDFQFFLQVQSSTSYKYTPVFVLCCDHFYLFSAFRIKDIAPKEITEIRWHYTKRGTKMVDIESAYTITIEMSEHIYTHFISQIRKYNPHTHIEV
ncbi:hypothetical protein [Capnocytophaga granulosa]|jgi:hypothetical protein